MTFGANLKPRALLAATVLGTLSLPLLAQQPAPPASAQPQASNPPAAAAAPATPAAPIADLRPVAVELEQKLDTKTAKNGDSVVAQTKANIKTADGTEIPKGSKLIGHILAVQPANGQNSQIALKFDQVQIKGGQSLTIQSQIQSITPAGMDAAAPDASASSMNTPPASTTAGGSSAPRAGSPASSTASNSTASAASPSQGSAAAGQAGAPAGPPAPGTVVAQNGGINITTTSVPGVLLANNAPGQQDPRLAKVSSILLGARRDIQLDSGTKMTIGVAAGGQ